MTRPARMLAIALLGFVGLLIVAGIIVTAAVAVAYPTPEQPDDEYGSEITGQTITCPEPRTTPTTWVITTTLTPYTTGWEWDGTEYVRTPPVYGVPADMVQTSTDPLDGWPDCAIVAEPAEVEGPRVTIHPPTGDMLPVGELG